jgi:hypothetical protein
MNIHQHVLPTTTIAIPNVSILRTKAMNPSIGHTTIFIKYQTIWSQPITPIVLRKTSIISTSTYPMWYNVIPPFVPLDPSLYPTYQTRAKGLDSLIFRNYISYVPRNVYPIPEQPIIPPTYIPNFVGNQFPTVIQLVINKDKQPVTTSMPTTIQVITNLPTYVPRRSNHQTSDGG